jgi:hypothetical protein
MMKTDWSNLNYWTNREFLHDDNAYIWDGGKVPAWRGQRCSGARLSRIIYRLHRAGCPTHLDRGFTNAGLKTGCGSHLLPLLPPALMWIHPVPSTRRPLVSAAYRILLDDHERRFGQLAIRLSTMTEFSSITGSPHGH